MVVAIRTQATHHNMDELRYKLTELSSRASNASEEFKADTKVAKVVSDVESLLDKARDLLFKYNG